MSDLMPRQELQVLNPVNGEVLTLDAKSDQLGAYLADVREFEFLMRESKRAVTQELLARMDKNASWTMSLPGWKLSSRSSAKEEAWDGAELRTALLDLVDEDVISIEAVDAAVETVVTYKPRKVGINNLRKLGGRVAAVVNGLCVEREPDRSVKVERVGL